MYLTVAFSNVTDTFVPRVRELEYILYDRAEAIFLFRGSGDNLCQKKQTDHALNAPVKPKEKCTLLSNI